MTSTFARIGYQLGFALRETGQALDRLGSSLQGKNAFKESLNRHRRVMALLDSHPKVATSAFVAPSAHVIGNVKVAPSASVWYGSVVRGDANKIEIGEGTNVQDKVTIHAAKNPKPFPTTIGAHCTIQSGSILHACEIKDDVFVGAGARILDGAVVNSNAVVAAGSLVSGGTVVPSGQLWEGVPAKYVRDLSESEITNIRKHAEETAALAAEHLAEHNKGLDMLEVDAEIKEELEQRDPEHTSRVGYHQ